jgi:hypothetical protein
MAKLITDVTEYCKFDIQHPLQYSAKLSGNITIYLTDYWNSDSRLPPQYWPRLNGNTSYRILKI